MLTALILMSILALCSGALNVILFIRLSILEEKAEGFSEQAYRLKLRLRDHTMED